MAVDATPRSPVREPQSALQAAALFAAGFAVVQPAMQWLLHLSMRAPLPVAGPDAWAAYVAAVAGLGAAVGAAWHAARARPHSRWAAWAGSTAQYVAMAALLGGRYFGEVGIARWYGMVVAVAAATALLWGGVGRLLRPVLRPVLAPPATRRASSVPGRADVRDQLPAERTSGLSSAHAAGVER